MAGAISTPKSSQIHVFVVFWTWLIEEVYATFPSPMMLLLILNLENSAVFVSQHQSP